MSNEPRSGYRTRRRRGGGGQSQGSCRRCRRIPRHAASIPGKLSPMGAPTRQHAQLTQSFGIAHSASRTTAVSDRRPVASRQVSLQRPSAFKTTAHGLPHGRLLVGKMPSPCVRTCSGALRNSTWLNGSVAMKTRGGLTMHADCSRCSRIRRLARRQRES